MAQLHFTLDYDFFVGLFSETKDEAFGKLMEALLNQVLQAESAEQLGAENYERSSERSDYRNGTRTRSLTTRIGKIELQVPRHRNVPFKTTLFENYQRNEQALITTMMEMVIQGVSTRNVKKVTEELCGESFSKSTVSEICKELDVPVKHFKERLLPEHYPFIIVDSLFGFYLRKKNYTKAEKYLDYFSEHDPMKSYYQGRLLQEQGKIKEAYEKYENVIFSGFSTLNFVLSTMAGLALRENDIGYARFLSGKVQAVAHILEMGKYNEYSPMLDIVCAGKDVEGTYKVIKHLLDNVGTMYDFRKSGLYKHMKFRDIDEAILDSVKEKLLEGFRNEEEFGYMTGYEPWEKLIFDR